MVNHHLCIIESAQWFLPNVPWEVQEYAVKCREVSLNTVSYSVKFAWEFILFSGRGVDRFRNLASKPNWDKNYLISQQFHLIHDDWA